MRRGVLPVLLATCLLAAGAAPVSAEPVPHRFPITGCQTKYGRAHHGYPASDIFARKGCAVVSVTNGTVHEVARRDRWNPRINDGATRGGRFVSVIGDDGVRYYYSHLSAVARGIEPGRAVRAGQRLGSVGTSGSARGTDPHLHFGLSWPTRQGIWWVRRGQVAPAPYLDAWKEGRDTSPAPAVRTMRDRRGEVPRCSAEC